MMQTSIAIGRWLTCLEDALRCHIASRVVIRLVVLTNLIGLPLFSSGQSISINFQEIRGTDARVTFETECSVVSVPPDNSDRLKHATSRPERFRLHYAPGETKLATSGYMFDYLFFLEDLHPSSSHKWLRCPSQVTPNGDFPDRIDQVKFQIVDKSKPGSEPQPLAEGEIEIPIHSIGSQDLVKIRSSSDPAIMNLASPAGIEIEIESALKNLDVIVQGTAKPTFSPSNIWQPSVEGTAIDDGRPIRIKPGRKATVRLGVAALRFPALFATLTSVRPDRPHDIITAEFSYATDVGGSVRTIQVPLKVRFVPSIPSLAFALILGSLLGTLIGQLVPGAWKGFGAASESLLRGVAFGFAGELGALLLVAIGSRFVMAGFELDPWQFLPVLVIGFLTSGGAEIWKAAGLSIVKRTTSIP